MALATLALSGASTTVDGTSFVLPSDEALMTAEGALVAAVTVAGTQPPVGTRANPPRVLLRIDAILRGTLRQKEVEAVWMPPDYPGLYEGERTIPDSWLAEALPAPTSGTRLILLLSREGDHFRVSNRCRYPDTPQVRRQVLKAIDDYLTLKQRLAAETAADQQRRGDVEAARIEEWRAQLASLCERATDVWVGRQTSNHFGPDGNTIDISEARALKGSVPTVPETGYPYTPLLFIPKGDPLGSIAYEAHYQEVIVFLRLDRREGSRTLWRAVDSRLGLVRATPERVAETAREIARLRAKSK